MKNKYKEQQRLAHKLHGKGRKKGVYLYHDYSCKESNNLTWWDDFNFWLNGVRYLILFVHPRMKYKDTCDQIVWNKLYPSYPENKTTFIPFKTKKLGKSRKKAVLFTLEDSNKEAMTEWYKNLREQKDIFLKNSNVCVCPSVRVEWNKYSKCIEICVPYEILTEEQAKFFVEMVREHYKAGTLYEWVAKMKEIKYDCTKWNAEQ